MPAQSPIVLRGAVPDDAVPIAALSAQLGYAAPAPVICARLAASLHDPARRIIVACEQALPGAVLAWMEVRVSSALESGDWAEITGLVIEQSHRRRGIGRLLVAEAKAWAVEQGHQRLRVRTNVKRADAPAFYTNLGFSETKQQRIFDLPIP